MPDIFDTVNLTEVYDFDTKGFKKTVEGYMVCSPRVARTGIQDYAGADLGHPELDRVRVYRPEDQVFHKDAMKTLAHRPITLGHPKEMVDSKNWRKLAIGMSGDEVARDGDFIRVPMLIMDTDALDGTDAKELSVGYSSEIVWKAGMTMDGVEYDAIQRNIRANHIAVVTQARGGPKLRLGDRGEPPMVDRERITKTISVDGIDLVIPETEAAVVSRTLSRMGDEVTKLKGDITTVTKSLNDSTANITKLQKDIETKDGEIVALKKQVEDSKLTPAILEAAVATRTAVIDSARKVLGNTYTGAGKTEAQIKREAVEKKLGDHAKALDTDARVDGAFLTITAGVSPQSETQRLSNSLTSSQNNMNTQDGRADAEKAWNERQTRIGDAWKDLPAPARN